jgi:putative ABC transport system permease protein
MFLSTLLIALRQLRRNLLRSSLTVLGIVIGIMAVIAIVNLGSGATVKVTSDISSLGRNLLIVTRGVRGGGPMMTTAPAFEAADVEAIRRDLSQVAYVAPSSSQRVMAVAGNNNWSTTVIGSTQDYFTVREWNVVRGRPLEAADVQSGRMVCVLGQSTVKELFGAQDPLGIKIRLGRQSCEVIGVLEAKGQSSFGSDQDDVIMVPITAFQRRLSGTKDIDVLHVSAVSAEATQEAKSNLESLLRERRRITAGKEDDFTVRDLREVAEVAQRTTGIMTTFLSAVAAVSLVVGGIGIMNIMLVSVTERTREIGIRLAIGAKGSDILLQFLVEAVVLSVLGGAIGILLGVAATVAGARMLDLPFVFEPMTILLAFGFSSLIGIAFGFFPARRAAKLDPIEALRYE